jgi:hypothetical protein
MSDGMLEFIGPLSLVVGNLWQLCVKGSITQGHGGRWHMGQSGLEQNYYGAPRSLDTLKILGG